MAGHSKWANIKHRKGAQDAKKGKIFTKLVKEITVSVKEGGAELETNPRLRLAVQNARGQNMPKDNIEKAIKKASGDTGTQYIETTFEGYGPEGVAIFVECATDNNTRTVSNVRSYFNKYGGSLGKDGCLQFLFDQKGIFTLSSEGLDEDEFTLEMIDAGAEEVEFEYGAAGAASDGSPDGLSRSVMRGEATATITTAMEDFGNMQKKLNEMKLEPKEAGLQRIPVTYKEMSADKFQSFMKLIDALEDDDDVQKVYHNLEYSDELANSLD